MAQLKKSTKFEGVKGPIVTIVMDGIGIAAENEGKGDVVLFQPPMKGDSVRKLADSVAHRSGGLACVFAGENGQYAYAMVQAQAQDISALVKDMNKTLNGRGGGRNGFAQGSLQATQAEIEAFFQN